jgi:hypothetical protein
MPVIRTFIARVKPGRMQDAVAQLAVSKRLALDVGATDFTAYNIVTGPNFPGLAIHAVFDDLAAWGAAREQAVGRPEWAQIFGEDAPTVTVNAVLSESVYTAGDVASIIGQTKVRFSLIARPHRGRAVDAIRRGSRLADTILQCGALAADLRRGIAGTEAPQMGLHSFHAGFAEWQATRNAVLESDVWNVLNRSQDEVVTRTHNIICTKIDV